MKTLGLWHDSPNMKTIIRVIIRLINIILDKQLLNIRNTERNKLCYCRIIYNLNFGYNFRYNLSFYNLNFGYNFRNKHISISFKFNIRTNIIEKC